MGLSQEKRTRGIGRRPNLVHKENGGKLSRDKRHQTRRGIAPSIKSVVEIPLPFPKGVKIVKEVIDLSEKGLAFKMTREEGFLLPGTNIKNLTVYHGDTKEEKPLSEVMYAVPSDDDGSYKIGIKYTGGTAKRSALGRKALNPSVRPLRYDLAALNQQRRFVKFIDHNGQEHSAALRNISPYGLAFELEKVNDKYEDFFKLSQIIDHFQVVIGKEVIYDGKVTTANIRPTAEKVVIGVALKDKSVNIQKVLSQTLIGTNAGISEWAIGFLKLEKVDQAFKALVADTRYFLEEVKSLMDEEETKASNEGMTHRKMIERAVISRFEQPVYEYLDRAMRGFNKLVADFDEERHAYCRDYFQKHLGPLIWLSPFAKRCYLKPLGYAGDYELMDMIYRAPYEGESFFAKLMNKYFCYHIPPARAGRNRVPYLYEKIEETVNVSARGSRKARILSFGCGPANEIMQFMRNSERSNDTEFMLVDIEPEALYFSQEMAFAIRSESDRNTTINIYYLSLQQLLKEGRQLKILENHDLIYSAGLFDYLSDDVCRRTIETLFKFLSRNGKLIIGNFDPRNEFRCCMEYGAEWYLVYRGQNDLIRLAQAAVPSASRISCQSDSTGLNNFLIIEQ